MRITCRPDNPIEWMALRAGLVPTPLIDTQVAYTMARAIQAGVELGFFEALADGPLTTEELAERCETSPSGSRALLGALCGCRYVDWDADSRRWSLTPVARTWLLDDAPRSLTAKLRFQQLEWQWLTRLEDYVRTGEPMDLHRTLDADGWQRYQRGMADIGRVALAEVARRTPIPRGARTMLDVGGSGGTHAAAFLERYPDLRCTILDLPEAIEHAGPLVTGHGLGERLELVAGDVVDADLGEDRYDVVFMSNVAHHLSDADNRRVAAKVARALRKGGVYVVQEIARSEEPSSELQVGALTDLYFALTSRSGTFSAGEIAAWLDDAGLKVRRPIWYLTAPGLVQVFGVR